MKILFIGGTGVLSTDIVKFSIVKGYDVYLLNRGTHKNEIPKEAHLIIGDIRDTATCKNLLSKYNFDIVADFLSYNPRQLQATIDIISEICTHYIFVSSACSYRRASSDFPIVESSAQPNLALPYGIEKFECEQLLSSGKWKFQYTIVRPYITYGDIRIPFGIAPAARMHWTLAARILSGKPLLYWSENGHVPACTLTHTKDFAVGFCGLFLNDKAFNEDFNIVGDEVYSWQEVVTTIYDVLEVYEKKIVEVPASQIASTFTSEREYFRGDRNLDAIFDNNKIKKAVPEFKTSVSLKEGIANTLNYYRMHDYLCGIDYRYDALCDRIVSKCGFKVSFIDYLNQRSLQNRSKYELYRHLGDKGVRFLSKFR